VSSRAISATLVARTEAGRVLYAGSLAPVGRGGPGLVDCARFDATRGAVALDLTVRDDSGRVIEVEARDLDVPDFAAAATAGALLLPVEISRAGPAGGAPAASRAFSRIDRLRIRVPTTDDAVTVTARLLDRAGRAIRGLDASAMPPGAPAEFPLPLSSLAPAQYQIEVVGRSSTGATHTERIAFRIEG
jgi:hypothetical protein